MMTELLLFVGGNATQVVTAAQGRIPVYLDGGVRRGTDVFKALALGASGIFVSAPRARPSLHAAMLGD